MGVTVTLVAVLILSLFLLGLGQVWAQSFNPNPPIAGQTFTISGVCGSGPCVVIVILQTGFGCGNGNTVAILGPFNGMVGGPGSYTATVPGQLQGTYSTFTLGGESCVIFTVVPATTTTTSAHTVPVYVGAAYLAHKTYCTASPTHC